MLHALADTLGAASESEVWPIARGDRLLLAGMGSSWFAAETAARRLRRAGVHAVAEMASVEASYPPDPRLVVVGISANGGSKETLALLGQHHGTSRTVALTNNPDAELPVDRTVLMHAGRETGGVACRSYVHTLALLLQLEQQLTGGLPDLETQLHRAADAAASAAGDVRLSLPPGPVADAVRGALEERHVVAGPGRTAEQRAAGGADGARRPAARGRRVRDR